MRSRLWLCGATLVAAFTVVSVRPVNAQLIQPGLTAGASLSTFTGNLSSDFSNYATFFGGVFVRVGMAGFGVQPGLYYTGKGAKFGTGPDSSKVALDYIQIPIVIRINLPAHLYVGAGPAIGIKLSCKITPNGAVSQDCANSGGPTPKSTETDGILEAGIQFNKFALGGRADFGLTNALEAVQTGSTANVTAKTRTLSAVLEIRF